MTFPKYQVQKFKFKVILSFWKKNFDGIFCCRYGISFILYYKNEGDVIM